MQMLVAGCPRCGAPSRVSLATPHAMHCRSCGYQGPPPADAQQRLVAASGLLQQLDRRRRQLSGLQRWVLIGSVGGLGCAGLLFAGVAAVMAVFALIGVIFLVLRVDLSVFFVFVFPLLLYCTLGIPLFVFLRRQQSRLRLACAAIPPEHPGESAACHVCGADLPPAPLTRHALARCGYCAADNIVDTKVMTRAAASQVGQVSSYESVVQNEAKQVGTGLVAAGIGLLTLPLLCLWAGCMGAYSVLQVAQKVEVPPPDERYLVARTPDGACVAEMRGVGSDGRGIVVFDPPVPRGVEFMNTDQAGLDKYPDVRARAFVGRKGFVREHSAPSPHGVVLRVVATRADPYTALVVLRTAEGDEVTGPLTQFCADDGNGLPLYEITPESPRR